ncbi:MAG TPA: basic secretory protein-like protein [Humisphaera sp.]
MKYVPKLIALALFAVVAAPARGADAPATRPAAAPGERPTVKMTAKHPKTKEDLVVLLDWNDAPAAEGYARRAGEYALKVYPQIEQALASDGYTPTREFRLLFKPVPNGTPAYASGTTITCNSDYVTKGGKDDLGMVGHELAHVIQRYRRGNVDSGWLTEGIADWVRYYVLEPGSPRARFDVDKAKFKDAYQPAAAFLDYLERTKGPGVVSKLNAALRAGKYKPEMLQELVGGAPEEAFEKFRAEAKEKRAKKKAA